MKPPSPEAVRSAENRRRYPEREASYLARAYAKKKQFMNSFKDVPCARCGTKYPPICMDFHHRDPRQKAFTISHKVASASRSRIIAEISKCDVLCANCHRMVDHEELNDGTRAQLVLQ